MTQTPDTTYRAALVAALAEIARKVSESRKPSPSLLEAQLKLLAALSEHDNRPAQEENARIVSELAEIKKRLGPIEGYYKATAIQADKRIGQVRVG